MFAIIDTETLPADTDDQVDAIRSALQWAGEPCASVWVGDPGCPDAYETDRFIFA